MNVSTPALDRARRLFQLRGEQFPQCESVDHVPPLAEAGNYRYLKRFSVRHGNQMNLVPVSEVSWIEGLGDYAGLHVGQRVHLIRESLSSLSCRLNPQIFLRIHRSAIVQVDRIREIKTLRNRDLALTLQDGTTLRASRTYSAKLQSTIGF